MFRKINLILFLGLAFFCSPSHAKEISRQQENLSSSIEEIAEEMNNLNSSLDLLSITISNLMSRNSI